MTPSLDTRLPWRELAAGRRTLSGRIDASELAPRLGEALARDKPAGTIDYELRFAPAGADRVAVDGRLAARLEATCQRCLRPFEMPLEVAVELEVEVAGPVAEAWSEAGAAGAERADAETLPTLAALIEEELILALPFQPRHAQGECPAMDAGAREPGGSGDGQRPFEGLREALERARRGDPE